MIKIQQKQFSITGDFKHLGENLTRKNIISVLEGMGGNFKKGSKSTEVWLVGPGAGSKKDKIGENAIIIDSPFEISEFKENYMPFVGLKKVNNSKINVESQSFVPSDSKYVIIDIETTGFTPNNCEIIEIGAILVNKKMNVIDSFESFVYSDFVPQNIEDLTGITTNDLINAPDIKQVLKALSAFAKGATPIAHYSPFDKRFIRYYLEKTDTKFVETEWIDSIGIFKKKFNDLPNYKLATLITHFNLAEKEDHRALSDAKHTLTLLKKAME